MIQKNSEKIAYGLMIIGILILVGFSIPEYTLKPIFWKSYIWIPILGACFTISGIGVWKIPIFYSSKMNTHTNNLLAVLI